MGVAVRYVPLTNHVFLVGAVSSPYLMLAAPAGLVLLAIARRWKWIALAGAVAVAVAAIQLPLFIADRSDAAGVRIRVMTANLYLGQADANAVVATANAAADVLAVQELTPDEVDRLTKAGLDETFPYRVLDARDYASGGGLWSRYPISTSHVIDGYKLATLSARVSVPGVSIDPALLVAHLPGPWPQPMDDWEHDLGQMRETLEQLSSSAGSGCAFAAGDFNSTLDMKPFRSMMGSFDDGVEQAGAGFIPTYPGNSTIPPFMAIDHVLSHRCTATSARAVGLPGSDHRGLVVDVDVPRTATSH